jgi:hypothetical protein
MGIDELHGICVLKTKRSNTAYTMISAMAEYANKISVRSALRSSQRNGVNMKLKEYSCVEGRSAHHKVRGALTSGHQENSLIRPSTNGWA